MSNAEMQACLARLYVDDPFRKLFFIDPEAAWDGYRLTEAEKNALGDLDPHAINFFASSLKRKREGKIRNSYPLLYKLDPVEIQRYYDRYYQLYPARPNQPFWEDILEFGRFMEETLATADDLPVYAGDLAKYERLVNTVSLAPVPERDSPAPETANGDQNEFKLLIARPQIDRNSYVETFTYDVIAIEDELAADQVPVDPEPGEYFIIFQRLIDSFEPKIFTINLATKRLLNLCDGRRPVLEIITSLEETFQAKNAGKDIIKIINRFRTMNVIRI